MAACSCHFAPAESLLTVTGPIDERAAAPLAAVGAQLPSTGRLTIHCRGIESINSIGLAAWLGFLDSVPAGLAYEFRECPAAFLNYCSLMDDFLRRGTVASAVVNWDCLDCSHQEARLFTTAALVQREGLLTACPKCQSGELDVDCDVELLAARAAS